MAQRVVSVHTSLHGIEVWWGAYGKLSWQNTHLERLMHHQLLKMIQLMRYAVITSGVFFFLFFFNVEFGLISSWCCGFDLCGGLLTKAGWAQIPWSLIPATTQRVHYWCICLEKFKRFLGVMRIRDNVLHTKVLMLIGLLLN